MDRGYLVGATPPTVLYRWFFSNFIGVLVMVWTSLKIWMWFGYFPQIIFCHFFQKLNLVIFPALSITKWIDRGYLVFHCICCHLLPFFKINPSHAKELYVRLSTAARLFATLVAKDAKSLWITKTVVSPITDPGVMSDPGSVPYFRGNRSTIILILPLIQEELVSDTSESMCTKHWLTAQSILPRKKCD